jgi:ABC-type sugar transport system ATPase subunit
MKLELRDITVAAGSFTLGPLSLAAGDGEYLIVLGPTGAGKTVTLETIAGLRRPASGAITIDDADITHAPPEARKVGFLFQESLLFPHLSVRRNIAYGTRGNARDSIVEAMAQAVGVEALLERSPRGLSGGERQRVALARALATSPRLLLLDEPMAALDPNSRHALRVTLLELHRRIGTTTIHVTHNFSEALALGDRVAILIDGRILQAGPTREVFSHPASPVIAGFLRSATRAAHDAADEPELEALTLCPRGLRLEMSRNGGDFAQPELAAETTALRNERPAADGGEAIVGKVLAVESDGGHLSLTLNVGLNLRAKIALAEPGAESIVEGASVWVRLPKDSN